MVSRTRVSIVGAVAVFAGIALAGPAAAEPRPAGPHAAEPRPAGPQPGGSETTHNDRRSIQDLASAVAAWEPIGNEPTQPYPQPADAAVPKRGCATTVSSPTEPPTTSRPSIQIIYAWHDGVGNRYEQYVEKIAKVVDRIDWLLDENTDYDQHWNFSCRTGYDVNSYAGYARSLVVPEKIEAGNNTQRTTWTQVSDDLTVAGYNDQNRWYFVFEDFPGTSEAAHWCLSTGGAGCVGVAELWDSGLAGHEMLHMLGAPHAWSKEDGGAYNADIMTDWDNSWFIDQDFNTYYDPSELSAGFYGDPAPATALRNIATHPLLTAPVCCDIGANNDALTAQERTIEATAPSSTPTGFTVTGAGWMQVTPAGATSGVSARYYDGRRSLRMNVQSHGESRVSVTRRPAVTAGTRYKFFTRMTTATATTGQVRLRMSWYNSAGSLISHSDSALIALDAQWPERSLTAVAPTGATSVQIGVVAPAGQNFAYLLDSLQLNTCNNGKTSDGCRPGV